ncbi:MAG: ECF transporter S component, partial [Acidaminococcaceae bacterium]|nr:ECF transporter S component [Acidaminococcaceae bacterium]
MQMTKTTRLILAALFAAVCCVATEFLKIPGPLGYYHLGDGFCMLAGLILGPVWGGLAAGIGSALAGL